MTFLHPIWLLLALPLGAALMAWPPASRLLTGLRALVLLGLLAALGGIALVWPSAAGTVIVVADRSRSMPADAEEGQKLAIELLQAAMGPDERLGVVAFGQRVALERPAQTGKFAGFVNDVGGDASNLGEGIDQALALIAHGAPGKLLVLSDGHWTGRDPLAAAAQAAARGVAIDYRAVARAAVNDLAIARIDAPPSVGPGEAFLITAWVTSPVPQEVSFELRRGGQPLSSGKRALTSGLNRLTFRDRAGSGGTQAYTLEVTGAGKDPLPENNRARLLVGVHGPRSILVASDTEDSGLARLLRAGGLPIEAAQARRVDWSLEGLSRYAAVILENAPAERLGAVGMETVAAWVQQTGAGLMITGGRSSYGPGGYYKSPLEPILPVSMELRQEHRKLALAIVVALDRSGSMAAPVAGGRVKMDLANLGAAQVFDLLGPQDEFGVLAVDSQAHVIQDLAPASDRSARDKVLRIQSMGGGIFVYEALEKSLQMMTAAKAGTKHIILFADAADAEQPGNYGELLEIARKANITVSVIGMGKVSDKDGPLLEDIAKVGRGRCLFSESPEELPRLFAQDTFVVARSAFLDEPTALKTTAGLTALAGRPFPDPPAIGGYNLCYLRPSANLAVVTQDEYGAPAVAAWQAGMGRVLCYTGEADGQHTGPLAQWRDVGEFFSSLARWTQGTTGQLPANMLLTQDVRNGIAEVRLHLDPGRQTEPFTSRPAVAVLRAQAGRKPLAEKGQLEWRDPDTLALDVSLQGDDAVVTTVEVPGHGPVALAPVCLPYSPEFRPAEAGSGVPALERLARATGGVERVELPHMWHEMPREPRLQPLAPWLLLVAVLLLLAEVLERRTGLMGRFMRLPRRAPRPAPVAAEVKVEPALSTPGARPAGAAAPEPAATAAPAPDLLDALRQARSRTRRGG
jgi:Mg-chelatase subunit ChlD